MRANRYGRPKGLHYMRPARSAGLQACLVTCVMFWAPAAHGESVTYSKNVAPLVADRCESCHHAGGPAPFALSTYADVKRRAALIASVTKNRYMPPWKADPSDGPFVGQHPLSDHEIAMIQQWVDEGAIEGESVTGRQSAGSTRPAARNPQFATWQLGKPDLVVTMPQAYALQAEGADIFRIFVLPLSVSE